MNFIASSKKNTQKFTFKRIMKSKERPNHAKLSESVQETRRWMPSFLKQLSNIVVLLAVFVWFCRKLAISLSLQKNIWVKNASSVAPKCANRSLRDRVPSNTMVNCNHSISRPFFQVILQSSHLISFYLFLKDEIHFEFFFCAWKSLEMFLAYTGRNNWQFGMVFWNQFEFSRPLSKKN